MFGVIFIFIFISHFPCIYIHTILFRPHAAARSYLHWLPVHRGIQFKLAVINYITLTLPSYLRNLLTIYSPSHYLHVAMVTKYYTTQNITRYKT